MSGFNSQNSNADNSEVDPNVDCLSNGKPKLKTQHNIRSTFVAKGDESDNTPNNSEMPEHDSSKKKSRTKNDIPRELMGLCIDMDWCKGPSRTDRRNFMNNLSPTHKKGADYYSQQSSVKGKKISNVRNKLTKNFEHSNRVAEVAIKNEDTQGNISAKAKKPHKTHEYTNDIPTVLQTNDSESIIVSNLEFDMDMILKPRSRFVLYRSVCSIIKDTNSETSRQIKKKHLELYPGIYFVKSVTDYGLVSLSRVRNFFPKIPDSKVMPSNAVPREQSDNFKQGVLMYKNNYDYGSLSCFIFEDTALFEEGSKIELCVIMKSISVENYTFDIKRNRTTTKSQNLPKKITLLSCLSSSGLSSDFNLDHYWCLVFSRLEGKIRPNIRKICRDVNIKKYEDAYITEDRKDISILRRIILRNLHFHKYKDMSKLLEDENCEDILIELCSDTKCSNSGIYSSENCLCLSCSIAMQVFTADGYHNFTSPKNTSEKIVLNAMYPFVALKQHNSKGNVLNKINEDESVNIGDKVTSDTTNKSPDKPSHITEDDLTLDSIHRITRRMVKELHSMDSESITPIMTKNDHKSESTPQTKRNIPHKQTEYEKIKTQCKSDNTSFLEHKNKKIKYDDQVNTRTNNVTLKPFLLDVNDSTSGFSFVGHLIKFTHMDKNQMPSVSSGWNYAIIKYWDPKCRAFFVHIIKEEFCTSDEDILYNFVRDNSNDYFSDSVCWITSQSRYILVLSSKIVFDRSIVLQPQKNTDSDISLNLMDDQEPTCKVCNKRIFYLRESFNSFPSRFSSKNFDVTMSVTDFIKICKLKFDQPNYFFHNPLHSTIAALRELEKYNRKTIRTLLENNMDITSLILGNFERELINIYGRSLLYFCVKIIFWMRKVCGIKKPLQPDTMIRIVHWGLRCSTCNSFYHAKCLQYQHLRKPSPIMTNNNIIKRLSHHKLMCKIFRNQSSSGTYNTNVTSLPDLVGNYSDYDIIYNMNDNHRNTKNGDKYSKSNGKELKNLLSGSLSVNSSEQEDNTLLFPIFERNNESDSWVCHDCSVCTYCCIPINDPSAKQRFCHMDNTYDDPSSKSRRQYPQSFEEKLDSLQRSSSETKVKDVKCVSCNLSAHRACCNPPVPNLLFIESWKCDWCSQCISCGYRDTNGTEYLHWGLFFLLCLKCWESLEKNNFCGICYKVWTNYDSVTQKWVQCDGCKLWIHVECDDLAQMITDCPSSRSQNYRCKICRSPEKFYRCMKLLEQVFLVDKLNQFRYPVSPGCVVYWRLVTRPMNLITLLSKLENGEYKSINDFIFDIFLIPYNAKMVNMPNTKIYKFANIFERKCKQIVGSIMQLSLAEIDAIFENEIRKGEIMAIEPEIVNVPIDSKDEVGNMTSFNDKSTEKRNEGILHAATEDSAPKNNENYNHTSIEITNSNKCDELSSDIVHLPHNSTRKRKHDDFFKATFDTFLHKIFGLPCRQTTLTPSQVFLPKSFVPCGLSYVVSSVFPLNEKRIIFRGACNISENYEDLITNKKFILLQGTDENNSKDLYLDDETFLEEISKYYHSTNPPGILWKDFCIVCGSHSYSYYMIFCKTCGEAMHYYCAGLVFPPFAVKYENFKCASCSRCNCCDLAGLYNHSYDISNIHDLEFASALGWIPRSISTALYYTPQVLDDADGKFNDFANLLLPQNNNAFVPHINTQNPDKTISTPTINSFINVNEDIGKLTTPFVQPHVLTAKNHLASAKWISSELNWPIHSVKCAVCGLSSHLSCLRSFIPLKDIKELSQPDRSNLTSDRSQTLLLHENFIATVSSKHKVTPFLNYKSRSIFKNRSTYEFGKQNLPLTINDHPMRTNPSTQSKLANNFLENFGTNLNLSSHNTVSNHIMTSQNPIVKSNLTISEKLDTFNFSMRNHLKDTRDGCSVENKVCDSISSPMDRLPQFTDKNTYKVVNEDDKNDYTSQDISNHAGSKDEVKKLLPPRILNVAKKLAKCDELLKRIESEVSNNFDNFQVNTMYSCLNKVPSFNFSSRLYSQNLSNNQLNSDALRIDLSSDNETNHRSLGLSNSLVGIELNAERALGILNTQGGLEYSLMKPPHLYRSSDFSTEYMRNVRIYPNVTNNSKNGWEYDGSGLFTCGKMCNNTLHSLKTRMCNSNQFFLASSLVEQFDILQQIYNLDSPEDTTNSCTHSMKIRMKCNEDDKRKNGELGAGSNNLVLTRCILCGTLLTRLRTLCNKSDSLYEEPIKFGQVILPFFASNFILCRFCKSWRRYLRNLIHKIKETNFNPHKKLDQISGSSDKDQSLPKTNARDSPNLNNKSLIVDGDFIVSYSSISDLRFAHAQMDQMCSNTMVKAISLIRHLLLTSENIMKYIFSIVSSILPKNALEASIKRVLKNFIHSKACFPGGIHSSIYLSMVNSPLSPVIYTFWIHSLLNVHNEKKILKIFNQINENCFDAQLKNFYNTLFDINLVVNNCNQLGYSMNPYTNSLRLYGNTPNNSHTDIETSENNGPLKCVTKTSDLKYAYSSWNVAESSLGSCNDTISLKKRRIKASYHIMIKRFTNLIANSIRFYWTYRDLLSYKIFFKQLDFHTNFHKALSDVNLNQRSIKLLSKRMQQVLYYIINGDIYDEMHQNKKTSTKYPYFRRHLAHLILNGELNFYKDIQQRFDLCCLIPHTRIGKGTASPSFVLGKIAYEAETILYFLSQFSKFCRNKLELTHIKPYSQEKHNPFSNLSNPENLNMRTNTDTTDQADIHKDIEQLDDHTSKAENSNVNNSKSCGSFNLDEFNNFIRLTYKKMVKRFNKSSVRKSNHIESLIYKRIGTSLLVETISARAVAGDVVLYDKIDPSLESFVCMCDIKDLSESSILRSPRFEEYFKQQSGIFDSKNLSDKLKFLQTILPKRTILFNGIAPMETNLNGNLATKPSGDFCCFCSISENTLLRGSLIPWRNGYVHSECLLWSVDNVYLPRTFNSVFDDILFGYEEKRAGLVSGIEMWSNTPSQKNTPKKEILEEIIHRKRTYNLNLLSLPILPPVQIPDFVVENLAIKAPSTRCLWCNAGGASVTCSGRSCYLSFHLLCAFVASNRLVCAVARKERLFDIDTSSFDSLFPIKIYFTKRQLWCASCFRKEIMTGVRSNRIKELLDLNQNNLKAFFSLEGISPSSTLIISRQMLQSVRVIPKMIPYKNLDSFMVSQSQRYSHSKSSYMHSMDGHPLEEKANGFIESLTKPIVPKIEVERHSGQYGALDDQIYGIQNSVPSQYNFDSKYFLYGKVDSFNSPFSSQTLPDKIITLNSRLAPSNEFKTEVVKIGSLTILNLGDALLFGDNGRVYPIGFTSVRRFWNNGYYSNSFGRYDHPNEFPSNKHYNPVNSNHYRSSYVCAVRTRNGAPYFSIDLLLPPNSNMPSKRLSHGTNLNMVYETFIRLIGSNNSKPMEAETFFGVNLHIVLQKLRMDLSMIFMHRASKFSKIASFEKSVLGKGNANTTRTSICLGEHSTNLPFKIRKKNMNELISTTLDFKDSEPCEVDYDSRTNRTRSRKQYDMNNNAMQYRYLISLPPEKRLDVKPSAIHGLGLFATENIAAGEPVVEYVGELIRDVISDKREEIYSESQGGDGSCYMFRLDDELIVDATRKGNMSRFINHSCDPNCLCRIITCEYGLKHIVVFAKSDLKAGDEVTYDYQFGVESETRKLQCLCGAPNCLGRMN